MNMIHKVQTLSAGVQGRLELHMVGGFSDVRNYSEDLFFSIMRKYIFGELMCVKVENNFPKPFFFSLLRFA